MGKWRLALVAALVWFGFALSAAVAHPAADLARRQAEVARLEGAQDVKRLQRAFGYYVEKGFWREAADLFGRVLLRDPGNDKAQLGLRRARACAHETERVLDAQLEQAGRALEAGDLGGARAMLEEVVSKGGDRDRAHAMLDRLDTRAGSLHGLDLAEEPPPNAPPRRRAGPGYGRR